ncbi:hypothetical protein ACVIRM_006051 [Rhizobium laguerreae]
MAESRLSARSAKARDLAHRLARRENRSTADIVERALESYEIREAGREAATTFYVRLLQQSATVSTLNQLSKRTGGHTRASNFDLSRYQRHIGSALLDVSPSSSPLLVAFADETVLEDKMSWDADVGRLL